MNEAPKTQLRRLLQERKKHMRVLPVLLISALAVFCSIMALLSQRGEALTAKAAALDCPYETPAEELPIEEPTVEEPTVEEPTVEEPTVEEPPVEEPTVEEPTVEEPTVEEPTVEEPSVEEPSVEELPAEEPTVEEPTVEEPTVEEPTVEEPTVEEPTVEEPTVEEPLIEEPTVEEPLIEEPLVFEGEASGLRVRAEAETGAFPAGTSMELAPVEDGEILAAVADVIDGTVVEIQAVEIRFCDAAGNGVEPAAPVCVALIGEGAPEADVQAMVRVDGQGEASVVEPLETAAEPAEDGEPISSAYETAGVSVYALVGATLEKTIRASDGRLYTVSVCYGPEAQLPEDVELRVESYAIGSEEYDAAYRAVLEDQLARGEIAENADLTLSAFDISLLDGDGGALEPAAPVRVELKIHELEGVEDLSAVEDTLVIRHHVETEDGVVLETVAAGSADVSFETEGFSTFTVTWVDTQGKEQSYIRWRFQSTNTVGTLAVQYVLVDGDNKVIAHINSPKDSFPVSNDGTWEQRLIFDGNIAQSADQQMDLNLTTGVYTHTHQDNSVTSGNNPTILPAIDGCDPVGIFYTLTDGTLSDAVTTLHSYFSAYRYQHETGYAVFADLLGADGTVVASLNPGYVTRTQGWKVPCGTLYVAYRQTEAVKPVTVHHGYVENGAFVEFEQTPWGEEDPLSTGDVNNNNGRKFLIYDFEGYHYASAHLDSYNGTAIQPVLNRGTDGYQYCTDLNNANGAWVTLPDGGDVYVVYEKRAAPTEGGTPKVRTELPRELEAPTIQKLSVPNDDGTNTLSLSITGRAVQMEAEKLADVIVVMDISTSMYRNNMSDGRSRMVWAKEVINNLADDLLSKVNAAGAPLVRMALVSFGDYAAVVYGLEDNSTAPDSSESNLNAFKAAVNGLGNLENTNWEAALETANTMAVDPERATFVIFITDGDPTMRVTRGGGAVNYSDSDLLTDINLASARRWGMFGNGNSDPRSDDYNYALPIGESIVANGKYFYTIGVSTDIANLNRFSEAVKASTDQKSLVAGYSANDGQELVAAFADIQANILAQVGWSDVKMTDGITSLTSMVGKGQIDSDGEFTYWIAAAPDGWDGWSKEERASYTPNDSDFKPWTLPASCNPARYENGSVVWDMGQNFLLQDGVTYKVSFRVWPSQEASDIIAKLNNGTLDYDTLSEAYKAQIVQSGGAYTLITNEPHPTATYRQATQKEGVITITGEEQTLEFDKVENLDLRPSLVTVEKRWENDLDQRAVSEVTMNVMTGTEVYKRIVLNEGNGWKAEAAISCGLMKVEENGALTIYEPGHDFQLAEAVEYGYYWELDAGIYRPMIINNVETMLKKVPAPDGMSGDRYEAGGSTYYRIDGSVYLVTGSGSSAAATITATNYRRSNLNLTKQLTDTEGNPILSSEPFTFTIRVTDAMGADIWFSVHTDAGTAGVIIKDLETSATAETNAAGEKTGYYSVASGTEFTVALQPGWNLRMINLPSGSTFSIRESAKTGFEFRGAAIDNGAELSVDADAASASGVIEEPNKHYTVTVMNQALAQKVQILKTGEDGTTPLAGAVFDLYTKAGYEAQPRVRLNTAELRSGADGIVELGSLAVGEYYLVETKAPDGFLLPAEPVKITVSGSGVSYDTGTSISRSGEGVTVSETGVVQLIVTNTRGYELPVTGGQGTLPFRILGALLLLCAGAVLVKRRLAA